LSQSLYNINGDYQKRKKRSFFGFKDQQRRKKKASLGEREIL
ncbi:9787_t:CDS:1, partial [Scutellospora calospora]